MKRNFKLLVAVLVLAVIAAPATSHGRGQRGCREHTDTQQRRDDTGKCTSFHAIPSYILWLNQTIYNISYIRVYFPL